MSKEETTGRAELGRGRIVSGACADLGSPNAFPSPDLVAGGSGAARVPGQRTTLQFKPLLVTQCHGGRELGIWSDIPGSKNGLVRNIPSN